MSMAIEREIFIEAPVDVVWRAITEPDQIAQWFSDEADVVLQPGYRGSLTFAKDPAGAAQIAHITVQAFEPDRSFCYRWAYEPGTEPADGNSTRVEFVLTEEANGTRLQVTETGLDQMDWPQARKDEFASDHNRGWAEHIDALGEYATKVSA